MAGPVPAKGDAVKRGRYQIRRKSRKADAPFGVWDRLWKGWCTLPIGWPEKVEELMPLQWSTREQAEHWIQSCRMAWLWDKAPTPPGAGAVPRTVVEQRNVVAQDEPREYAI